MQGVSVLGIGECGTRVALELSAEFDLGIIGEILSSAGIPMPKIKTAFKFLKESRTINPATIPHFFLGDFNQSNKAYVEAKKFAEIAKRLASSPNEPSEEILEALQKDHETNNLGFTKDDIRKIDQLRKAKYYIPEFEMLDFYDRDRLLLAPQGAGGYQYLSEAVTDANPAILSQVALHPSRILFGVFGSGGGSGAGAVYSILSQDTRRAARLSLGLAVTPGPSEEQFFRNSGRFLVRFLSTDIRKRFDKLLLFSNRSAHVAAMRNRDGFESSNGTVQGLLNRYLAKVVYAITSLNAGTMDLRSGKAFDTLDCKRYFPAVASVGLASSSDAQAGFDELFVKALSPMAIGNEALYGLSTTVGIGSDQAKAISAAIEAVYEHARQDRTPEECAGAVRSLSRETGFYRVLKSVRAFYLCRSDGAIRKMEQNKDVATRMLQLLTGFNVEFTSSGFVNPNIREDLVLLILDAGISADIFESLAAYIKFGFLGDDQEKTRLFLEQLRGAMTEIRGASTKLVAQELLVKNVDSLRDTLVAQCNPGSADLSTIREARSETEIAYFEQCDFLPEKIRAKDDGDYFMTAEHVLQASYALLDMMKMSAGIDPHSTGGVAEPLY
ncbi:MAG TPA: hypothetical protein VF179_11685 [Thermoanaerobaculia bacterium]|nr:hypothetical protein [Thermoanaerobaculia bacterium]